MALNEAINKNKMLQKKKVKSVSIGNRYESLRRKMAASGKTLKPFINRKQTTRDMILSLKNRNRMVAAKQYEFARSNGFTHTESRISQNRQAKQAEKLKIIESKEGVAKIFKEMKQERMEAFSFQGKSN